MRVLLNFLPTLATITVGTAALEASVIAFESGTHRQDIISSVVSSSTLQQLLELRSKSFTASILKSSDENNVETLGKWAGSPRHLFGASGTGGDLDTIMVILEGFDDNDHSYLNGYGGKSITSTFATATTRDAFVNHLLEARPEGIVSPESRHCLFSSHDHSDSDNQKNVKETCLSLNSDFQDITRTLNEELLNQARRGESWVNDRIGTVIVHIAFKTGTPGNSVRPLLSALHSLASNGKKTTAVLLPDFSTAKKSFSRRAPEVSRVDHVNHQNVDTRSISFVQRSEVPLALAPVCYASNSSCNDATDACSGHGVCYEKSSDCYACRCFETSVKTEGGAERKIRWGGPACQKQDISSPFFLIAGVTTAIMVAISAAIGMLFRVGNTELPGVISAGVGAARGQK